MTKHNDDYVSFDKALRELNLREDELKRMVSEGEIKAFREGGSMKFRREDLESLTRRRAGEDELVFADSLEDDTGMVTEELSDEDTLLAEDDFEETAPTSRRSSSAPRARSTGRAAEAEEVVEEPGWVIGAAVVAGVVAIYGLLVLYSVATETPPGGLTGLFAN